MLRPCAKLGRQHPPALCSLQVTSIECQHLLLSHNLHQGCTTHTHLMHWQQARARARACLCCAAHPPASSLQAAPTRAKVPAAWPPNIACMQQLEFQHSAACMPGACFKHVRRALHLGAPVGAREAADLDSPQAGTGWLACCRLHLQAPMSGLALAAGPCCWGRGCKSVDLPAAACALRSICCLQARRAAGEHR